MQLSLGLSQSWLDDHLETFVRPQLGEVPVVDPTSSWVKTFNPRMLLAMNAVWDKAKRLAKGRVILLPGRDVWLFEVLARVQNDYPTVFRPELSSDVSKSPYARSLGFDDCFVLDTGYGGSVPRSMGIAHWSLIAYRPGMPIVRVPERSIRQVFPRARQGALGSLSSTLEGSPKYWTRAVMKTDNNGIYTGFAQTLEGYIPFKSAAMLTIHVARSAWAESRLRTRDTGRYV